MRCTSTRLIALTAGLIGIALFAPEAFAASLPLCADLAAGLAGSAGIKSVNSQIIPASGPNVSYCQVNILYGENDNQNIYIRVGLPLNSGDGGTGGIVGAWNGRTQGVGGGGCTGNLTVTAPVDTRYVGSGTDGGHSRAANDVATNFHCGGNLETEATVCKDVLAKYRHENQGRAPIDYSNTGVNRNDCRAFLGTQYNNP